MQGAQEILSRINQLEIEQKSMTVTQEQISRHQQDQDLNYHVVGLQLLPVGPHNGGHTR